MKLTKGFPKDIDPNADAWKEIVRYTREYANYVGQKKGEKSSNNEKCETIKDMIGDINATYLKNGCF